MKTKSILFNSEMVRAILDGRKTQTRRVVNLKKYPQYPDNLDSLFAIFERFPNQNGCPFGQIGDRLYVRESFTYWEDDEFGGDYLEYRTGHRRSLGEWEYPHPIYDHCIGRFGKWTPSIHAPRWASRITLEITGVRVERLQDISEEDAIAEGIEFQIALSTWYRDYLAKVPNGDFMGFDDAKNSFKSLWQSVYSNWDANPWVWVVEFSPLTIAAKEESQ
jgi:hypothetical protein